jgi:hypothetical protein
LAEVTAVTFDDIVAEILLTLDGTGRDAARVHDRIDRVSVTRCPAVTIRTRAADSRFSCSPAASTAPAPHQ